ncbi:MAG: GNAT family N-acetyltransferase [archaeon]
MKIRRARKSDEREYLLLLDQLVGSNSCSKSSAPAFRKALKNRSSILLCAEDGAGKVFGVETLLVVEAIRANGRRVIIDELVVDSAHRGKGIGSALVAEAISIAKKLRAKSIWVASGVFRAAAHRLYLRSGFKYYEHNFRMNLDGTKINFPPGFDPDLAYEGAQREINKELEKLPK